MNRASRRKAQREAETLALRSVSPQVRDPASLEQQWSGTPSISQWIASVSTERQREWATIDGWIRQAKLGTTEFFADFATTMLEQDDALASVYRTYTATLGAAKRTITVDPTAAEPDIAAEQARWCEAMLAGFEEIDRIITLLAGADYMGWSVFEILWERRGPFMMPVGLVWIHPDRIRWTQRFEPYLWDRGLAWQRARDLGLKFVQVGAEPDAIGGGVNDMMGIGLVVGKFVVHTPMVLPTYPMASGLAMAAVRAFYKKKWATVFELGAAEIAGSPRMLGKMTEQSNVTARNELFDALKSLSADSVGVVSGGSDIEILDPHAEGSGGTFDNIQTKSDASYSKLFLGSTLNVEVGDTGGNRALGESQKDTTIVPRWRACATSIASTFRTQLFKPALEANRHLWGGRVYPPIMDIVISENVPEITSDMLSAGVKVTQDEARASLGLPPLGPDRGGDEFVSVPSPADANIYKAQLAVNPRAVPPAGAAATPAGGAAPLPFRKPIPVAAAPKVQTS